MNAPYSQLHSLFCMQNLTMPQDFTELPPYRKLIKRLSAKQRSLFLNAFDDFSREFCLYSASCFDQGVRFAFSLFLHLYRPQDIEH